MNVLEEIAHWVASNIKPTKSGIYITYHKTGGTHAWHYSVENGFWGDGIYTPNKGFEWLNVRIDLTQK